MNSLNDIKNFLKDNPGYLKWGKAKLAYKFGVSTRDIQKIKAEVNYELQENINIVKRINYPKKQFKRLFFDIETSPNLGWFWRSTYNTSITPDQILEERRIITVSWKWEGEDEVHHLNWDKNKSDEGLLKEFTKVIQEADECIAHNGDRFDIPWLRTRCIILGLPFPTYVKSLDTLRKVRSMTNFQSKTLNYIADILGFGTKKPTGGSKLWTDLTFKYYPGQEEYKKQMSIMHEYCDFDVVLLEKVYARLMPYIKPNTHVGRHLGKDKCSCPNCGSDNVALIKNQYTSSGTMKRLMGCADCSSDYVVSNRAYNKKFKKDK